MTSLIRLSLAAGPALVLATTAHAQDHANVEVPDTIRVIVAYSAGGSTDTLVRTTVPYFEQCIEELSGKTTSGVVANMPGAGGEIGWTQLANAEADGSTIGLINLPAVPLVEAAREAQYEPWLEKFVPIGVNIIDPAVVSLGAHTDFASLQEAIEAAKNEPGSVIVGADGPLSDDHLATYALAAATGAEFAFIPYAGSAPATQAYAGGEVDLYVGNVTDSLSVADASKESAVFRPERYEMIPDIPTVQEQLGVEVPELGSTRGFAAPAGVPEDILALYRDALECTFSNAEYQDEARGRSLTLVEPRMGDEFGELMQNTQAAVGDLLTYFVEGGYIEKP